MKDEKSEKDILAKAMAELKQRGASSQPPQELVNETLAQLERAELSRAERSPFVGSTHPRPWIWSMTRLAAAAVILIVVGYGFGRASAPPQPDISQLRDALIPVLKASLEPAIRASVAEDTVRTCQQAMAAGYLQVKDDLTEQYRADLNRFAVQTLAASNAVTNRLLEQLVVSVNASQLQDRRWMTAALEQIEAKRAEDNTELGTALVSLAAATDTKLQRTEDMVRLLANRQPDVPAPTDQQPNHLN
jgi:hypothetical protein